MNVKWFATLMLVAVAGSLLVASSCADPQELTSITIQPGVETVGAPDIPVIQDAGFQVQLRALGNYIHPPVSKDITNQVTWASNTTQMFTVSATGLLTATGNECGGTLVSATVTTNADGSGVSSSGAVVTGTMSANVTCFTGAGPTVTINFSGNGAGTVSSFPVGLSCTATCTGSFPTGTPLQLTAAASGTFGGWSGCNSTTGANGTVCNINDLTNDITLTVMFN